MKKIPSSVGAVSQDMNLTPHTVANRNIVLLWIYRILVRGEGYKSFVRQHDFLDDKLAEGLGFADYIFSDEPIVFNSTEIKRQLFKQAEQLEKNRVNSLYTDIVFKKNIESLGSLIGLTNVEIDILLFCATVQIDSLLESATNILGNLSARAVEQIFSVCLGYSELDIRHALFPDGRLAKSGLIKIDMGCNCHFSQKIEILEGLIVNRH
ncbi:hypothetical protein [Methylotenera sp. 1P/1]|uniref:hypothetical protein n=1 Tax=Methylotenera sp. 1P/1 TaxID=1131551 RepID=UPI0003622549|nr:hypothetical protein [Methylotenera sp. 1P/1]